MHGITPPAATPPPVAATRPTGSNWRTLGSPHSTISHPYASTVEAVGHAGSRCLTLHRGQAYCSRDETQPTRVHPDCGSFGSGDGGDSCWNRGGRDRGAGPRLHAKQEPAEARTDDIPDRAKLGHADHHQEPQGNEVRTRAAPHHAQARRGARAHQGATDRSQAALRRTLD